MRSLDAILRVDPKTGELQTMVYLDCYYIPTMLEEYRWLDFPNENIDFIIYQVNSFLWSMDEYALTAAEIKKFKNKMEKKFNCETTDTKDNP